MRTLVRGRLGLFVIVVAFFFSLAGPAFSEEEKVFAVTEIDVRPKVSKTAPVDYPYYLKRGGITGEATVEFVVTAKGLVRDARVLKATAEEFGLAALKSVQKWRFEPGQINGQPMETRMTQIITFTLQNDSAPSLRRSPPRTAATKSNSNAASPSASSASSGERPAAQAPLRVDLGEALLREWVQPEYPPEAKTAKKEGRVAVEFVVDVEGRVSQAVVKKTTDAQFNAAALAAVNQWVFTAALEAGKPVESAMQVEVEFKLSQLNRKRPPTMPDDFGTPHEIPRKPATPKRAHDPDYPIELEAQKLNGLVRMSVVVGVDGRAREPRVLWASNVAFVEEALRAIERTEFSPEHQGPLKRESRIEYPVEFTSMGSTSRNTLDASQVAFVDDAKLDGLPEPLVLIEPIYPFARLVAAEEGNAEVGFTLKENGSTAEVTVISCSAPEFGAALVAAVEAWGFRPAVKDGNRVAVKMRVARKFTPPEEGNPARIAAAFRHGDPGGIEPRGLDRQLRPLWRGFPVYPQALAGERLEGEAQIEFIIDRDGRARFPRVISATREEFGWAAATAISQWIFERPTKNGEPVDLKVAIPVGFTPPKSQ